MVLVAVLTPLLSVALLALLFFLPATFQMGIVIALTIGLVSWAVSYSNRRGRQVGRVLTEADDPELLETVDRLCAIADIPRPEVRLVEPAPAQQLGRPVPRLEPAAVSDDRARAAAQRR